MKSIRQFLETVFVEFQRDDLITLSAAFVYYAALSVLPLLMFLLAVLSMLSDLVESLDSLLEETISQVAIPLNPAVQPAVIDTLEDLKRGGIVATIVGLVILLWGASIVFRFLRISFRKIFGQARGQTDAMAVARELFAYSTVDRFWGFALVFITGMLLVASIIAISIAQLILFYWGVAPATGAIYYLFGAFFTFVFTTLTVAVLYRFLAPITLRWSDIFSGAIMVGIGSILLRIAISLYFAFLGSQNTHALIGTLLVLLVYVYAFGMTFFLGAEITKVRMLRSEPPAPPEDGE